MNDGRSLLALLACVGFYVLYIQYLQNKYPDYGKPPVEVSQENIEDEDKPVDSTSKKVAETEPPIKKEPSDLPIATLGELFVLENNLIRVEFSGNNITQVTVKDYLEDAKSPEPVHLGAMNLTPYIEGLKIVSAQQSGNNIIIESKTPSLKVIQNITIDNNTYALHISLSIFNISESTQKLNTGYIVEFPITQKKEEGGFSLLPNPGQNYKSFLIGIDGSRDSETTTSVCDEDIGYKFLEGIDSKLGFLGYDDHYFLKVLVPEEQNYSHSFKLMQKCVVRGLISQNYGNLAPKAKQDLKFKIYLGPKETTALENVDTRLTETLDLGWFSAIGKPLLAAVRWIHSGVGNYGLAIVILTIFLKILFYPLTKAASVSMKNMQKFTPEMNRIKEKNKNDRQKQQQELMAFMSKHKINPAKGCFPILPQIPVFIAFYNVLSQTIELRHAPFYGWIHDLSSADPYYITPIVLGGAFFLQQKLTPNPSMDETQKKIMMMMPIMFSVMMISLPAGMVLYMLTNTFVSIFQQQWLNRTLKIKV